jgi:transcriptional regulator with XRE-family HTH domain
VELRIGENIKRLRREKGMTQENLAELLNVSCAAVSKWESTDTYPDIKMLIPLARVFDVDIDTLMGYDSAKTEMEIEEILKTYVQHQNEGRFGEASTLIADARNTYPADYRIMHRYMWDKAGGYADNDPTVLTKHSDELTRICDCLLDGCTDEEIRLDALAMKAKLLHAAGRTDEAASLLARFPSWYKTSGQKTEQLYAKDTAEFRYWVRRNMYELADFTANKLIKAIWYGVELSRDEALQRCERTADMLSGLRAGSDENVFAVMEFAAFAELANRLTFGGGDIGDIIRVREKEFIAAKALESAAESDEVLQERLITSFGTADLARFTAEWLKSVQNEPLAGMRSNSEYAALLERFTNENLPTPIDFAN